MPGLRDRCYLLFQRSLPQHLLSRTAGLIANSRQPWLKDWLIRLAIRHYGIDLTEAAEPDPHRYASFNEFFTRALRPGVRPLADGDHSVAAPADGTISAVGRLDGNQLLQAKGHRFSLEALLDESSARTRALQGGTFITIYLSPRDYHRVHAPMAGELIAANYIPGRLFSVNSRTDEALPGLYSGNERLVCWLDTEAGKIALVMVGALLVAGIETVWQGLYPPGRRFRRDLRAEGSSRRFARGEEIGRFRFGSTVILLLPPTAEPTAILAGQPVRMGQGLAQYPPASADG